MNLFYAHPDCNTTHAIFVYCMLKQSSDLFFANWKVRILHTYIYSKDNEVSVALTRGWEQAIRSPSAYKRVRLRIEWGTLSLGQSEAQSDFLLQLRNLVLAVRKKSSTEAALIESLWINEQTEMYPLARCLPRESRVQCQKTSLCIYII